MPAAPIRIAILGLHHDHVWTILQELLPLAGEARLVAAADPEPALRYKFERFYGASTPVGARTYDDYAALLEAEAGGLDAVYLYGSNRLSSRLAVEALARGLHVLVEKPMAVNAADATAMLEAARSAKRRLMINWPFVWWPQLQHALHLTLHENRIGRPYQINYRAAHEGIVEMGHSHYFAAWAEDSHLSGGGALIDYCCYGAVLSRVVLGQPTAVTGLWGNLCKKYLKVEDNAVILMQYPNAMAIAQASWTQHGKIAAYTPMIYGETGTLMLEPRIGGRLFYADDVQAKGVEVVVPEPAAHLRNANTHFLWAIAHPEEPLHPLCDPRNCRDAAAILDAGAASAREHSRLVPVSSD
jgi:predicted dehydrogenase